MHKPVPILIVMLTLATSSAYAHQVTNGSFEDTSKTFVADANKVDALPSGSLQIPGWTTFNGVPTAWIENGNPWAISASDGSFFLDLTGYANHTTYGGVMQSIATVPGTNYIATFDLGYGGNSAAFGGPVSVLASAAGSSATFTSGSGTPNPAVWNKETFSFMATSSTTDLSFKGISTAGGFYIGLDNVDVEAGSVGTVPELGTFALLLTGMAFLGGVARRRVHR